LEGNVVVVVVVVVVLVDVVVEVGVVVGVVEDGGVPEFVFAPEQALAAEAITGVAVGGAATITAPFTRLIV
jgi:hypothetical protein